MGIVILIQSTVIIGVLVYASYLYMLSKKHGILETNIEIFRTFYLIGSDSEQIHRFIQSNKEFEFIVITAPMQLYGASNGLLIKLYGAEKIPMYDGIEITAKTRGIPIINAENIDVLR